MYAPGVALFGLWITAITRWQATGILQHRLDQVNYGYIAAFYVLAATLFSISYSRANTPLLRQQLKWLYRGAWLAVLPFHAALCDSVPARRAHAELCSPSWLDCRWSSFL